MKANRQRLAKNFKNDERGNTLVLVTIFIVTLFGFAALSIDVARVYQEQRHVNVGTDAGALAGVAMLTNSPQVVGNVVAMATNIAGANGVTAAEIAAGAREGLPGQVQVGIWSNGAFRANQQTSAGLYTAVRVPARRTVELYFAKVVGMDFMRPAVSSVANLEPAGRVDNAVPFGVSLAQVTGKVTGDTMILNDAAFGSGKQGKLDLGDYQNTGAWQNDMLDPNGCSCTVSVGPMPVITGNAQVDQSFNSIPIGSIFIMPVVSDTSFSGNTGIADIIGFVLVRLISSGGNGVNWTATVQFVDTVVGSAGGGTCPPPCVSVRTLVE